MPRTCFICNNVINRRNVGSRWFRTPRYIRNRSRRRRQLCNSCALVHTPEVTIGHHHDGPKPAAVKVREKPAEE